jgi:hypothetical protein
LREGSSILIPLTEFKVHAAEVANEVTRLALDISGGYGYKRGPLERYFRDARAAIGMGPSNNIAREWIAERIVSLKAVGVNLVLAGFLHYLEEVEFFGKRVLPLVRQLEHAKTKAA